MFTPEKPHQDTGSEEHAATEELTQTERERIQEQITSLRHDMESLRAMKASADVVLLTPEARNGVEVDRRRFVEQTAASMQELQRRIDDYESLLGE